MPTAITRSATNESRLVLNFDSAPTMQQLLDALKAVQAADRAAVLKNVRGPNEAVAQSANRFTFILSSTTDTDVPITP